MSPNCRVLFPFYDSAILIQVFNLFCKSYLENWHFNDRYKNLEENV